MAKKKQQAVILFSGGGGVEAGMVEAGIEPLIAVEFDKKRPELSAAIAVAHEANFPRCKVIRKTVEEVAASDMSEFPASPDILWASPVCSNFSIAKISAEETEDDIKSAIAVCQIIDKLRPRQFYLENVPRYSTAKSFELINQKLLDLGYSVDWSVVDVSDYGIPQSRKRLILRSSSKRMPRKLPRNIKCSGWFEAIKDLLPTLPESEILPGQSIAIKEYLAENPKLEHLLVGRTGRIAYRVIPAELPSFTVLRSLFTDTKGNNRNRFADVWCPDGSFKQLTMECIRRLQTFPDWYQFPDSVAVSGSIMGYSVPPLFVKRLFDKDNHSFSVQTSSGNNEHYTPQKVINAAIATLGVIDLDPCSNPGVPNVPASAHFTKEMDGLSRPWYGRVYMNPPYSCTKKWVKKLIHEHNCGHIHSAIALLKATPDTEWYQLMDRYPSCHWNGRLSFLNPDNNGSVAPFASAVFYIGKDFLRFYYVFSEYGRVKFGQSLTDRLVSLAPPGFNFY
ncbi:MAG: hypothetical protein F6K65_23390 [Moorea sp. SIO3C2]|nr:hypothetical protein [Moorena sp. SIO3C2]